MPLNFLYSGSKLIWALILLGINIILSPRATTIAIVFILIVMDFITGIIKAKLAGTARTSEGYRKTLKKIPGYILIPIVLWLGGVYADTHVPKDSDSHTMLEVAKILKEASGWVMLFIIYIETTSIFENLYEIDKKSPFNKYFIRPLLIFLKIGIEHNPLIEAADKLKHDNKDEADKIKQDNKDEADKIKIDQTAIADTTLINQIATADKKKIDDR